MNSPRNAIHPPPRINEAQVIPSPISPGYWDQIHARIERDARARRRGEIAGRFMAAVFWLLIALAAMFAGRAWAQHECVHHNEAAQ